MPRKRQIPDKMPNLHLRRFLLYKCEEFKEKYSIIFIKDFHKKISMSTKWIAAEGDKIDSMETRSRRSKRRRKKPLKKKSKNFDKRAKEYAKLEKYATLVVSWFHTEYLPSLYTYLQAIDTLIQGVVETAHKENIPALDIKEAEEALKKRIVGLGPLTDFYNNPLGNSRFTQATHNLAIFNGKKDLELTPKEIQSLKKTDIAQDEVEMLCSQAYRQIEEEIFWLAITAGIGTAVRFVGGTARTISRMKKFEGLTKKYRALAKKMYETKKHYFQKFKALCLQLKNWRKQRTAEKVQKMQVEILKNMKMAGNPRLQKLSRFVEKQAAHVGSLKLQYSKAKLDYAKALQKDIKQIVRMIPDGSKQRLAKKKLQKVARLNLRTASAADLNKNIKMLQGAFQKLRNNKKFLFGSSKVSVTLTSKKILRRARQLKKDIRGSRAVHNIASKKLAKGMDISKTHIGKKADDLMNYLENDTLYVRHVIKPQQEAISNVVKGCGMMIEQGAGLNLNFLKELAQLHHKNGTSFISGVISTWLGWITFGRLGGEAVIQAINAAKKIADLKEEIPVDVLIKPYIAGYNNRFRRPLYALNEMREIYQQRHKDMEDMVDQLYRAAYKLK